MDIHKKQTFKKLYAEQKAQKHYELFKMFTKIIMQGGVINLKKKKKL